MDALLEHVPDRFEPDRLVVRCLTAADAGALNQAVCESIDELRIHMPWAQTAPTLLQSNADCRRMQAKFLLREDLAMMMFERGPDGKEGSFIGGTGLHRIEWSVRRFEIGYWCRRSRQGQGFVTEAVNALASMAFATLRARRVEVRMDDANRRSARVAERAGFTFEGVLRSDSLNPIGVSYDTRVYARVAPVAAN